MKAYKGFNANMTCRDFQYREGKTYECDRAKVCESGFHACLNPLDCFDYYMPGSKSVYHEVELGGHIDANTWRDTKVSATKIRIGARLSIAELAKAAFDFVCNMGTNNKIVGDHGAASADCGGVASAGCYGAASAGGRGAASANNFGSASAGAYGVAIAGKFGVAGAGDEGVASAGRWGVASAGKFGVASAGDQGVASAGEYGVSSAGENGVAVSKGSASVGKNGIACVRGSNVAAKGDIGSILVIVEEAFDDANIKRWKWEAIAIDGKNYKPNTWYMLKNGKVVEARQ